MNKSEVCIELKRIAVMIVKEDTRENIYSQIAKLHNDLKDDITTPFGIVE